MIVKQRPTEIAFTIIELLIVMAIIIILAGLVLGISGYAHEKGARSRAEAEIAAMSAALESYKADNGIYPVYTDTDTLNPTSDLDSDPNHPASSKYAAASLYLYKELSGDTNADRKPKAKSYFSFPPTMLYPKGNPTNVSAIIDPFGFYFGYSTAKASSPSGSGGYNPTYDLWSTGGSTTDTAKWIKNW